MEAQVLWDISCCYGHTSARKVGSVSIPGNYLDVVNLFESWLDGRSGSVLIYPSDSNIGTVPGICFSSLSWISNFFCWKKTFCQHVVKRYANVAQEVEGGDGQDGARSAGWNIK